MVFAGEQRCAGSLVCDSKYQRNQGRGRKNASRATMERQMTCFQGKRVTQRDFAGRKEILGMNVSLDLVDAHRFGETDSCLPFWTNIFDSCSPFEDFGWRRIAFVFPAISRSCENAAILFPQQGTSGAQGVSPLLPSIKVRIAMDVSIRARKSHHHSSTHKK